MENKKHKKTCIPLSKKNQGLLKAFIEENHQTVKGLSRLIGIQHQTMGKALEGGNLRKGVRSKINSFIRQKGLNGKTEIHKSEKDKVKKAKRLGKPKRVLQALPKECSQAIEQFRIKNKITRADIAKMVGLARSTFQDIIFGKKTSIENIRKIEEFCKSELGIETGKLGIGKATRPGALDVGERVERIKLLLLLLELDLRFFGTSSEEARNLFRTALDAGDVGFIGSFLTSLTGNEAQFKRFLNFNKNKFNFFKRKGVDYGREGTN